MNKICYAIVCFLLVNTLQAQWIELPSFTVEPLTSVDFKDESTGLVCGHNQIWRTTNGGDNWSAVFTGNDAISLEEVRWASNQVAVAVGLGQDGSKGLILRSTDGGQSWTQVSNTIASIFTDVYFVNENTGYLCGGNTRILKTTNGGASWTSQFNDNDSDLFSIHFISENEGYAAGGVGGTGRLLRTTNGGTTWSDVSLPAPFLIQAVFFASQNVGYVAGVAGEMRKTVNGGTDWTELSTANTSNILDLYFFDHTFGFLVGGTLTVTSLQKTVNGGGFWGNDAPNAGAGLFSIDFAGTTGYAVGVNGTVVKTVVTVGTDEVEDAMVVRVFPNPTSGLVRVEAAEQPIRFVEVFGANGQVLQRKQAGSTAVEFDMSALPAGVYFLKIAFENGVVMRKIGKGSTVRVVR